MTTERFGITLNTENIAVSQITNYQFNSLGTVGRYPIAANENGLFILESADDDNGTEIDSIVHFVNSHLDYLGIKRFRKLYIGYETSGNLIFSVETDENNTKSYELNTSNDSQLQHRDIVQMTRDMAGVYWRFKIENIDGCDFSVDSIEGLPVYLTKSRG